jgi:TetR/AcrR family transcriptional regulator, cholesterol catabolism regulator
MPKKMQQPASSGIASRRRAAMADGSESYQARRQEIVRVAAAVFEEKGYEAATLNDIADRLGTDRASLYYYVGSKEDLLHEIVHSVLGENVAAAERIAAQDATPIDKIRALIEEMIVSFDRHYPHMYVYIEDMARIARQDDKWAREVVHDTKRFEAIVIDILEEGRADGSFRSDLPNDICALALFGMINWTHRWYKPGSPHRAEEIAGTFCTLFLDGFSNRGTASSGRRR